MSDGTHDLGKLNAALGKKEEPDHRTLWTIERLMFGGDIPQYLIKEEGTTRSYTVQANQLPQALTKALVKAVKARYKGGWDNKLQCVEGPVEVLSS